MEMTQSNNFITVMTKICQIKWTLLYILISLLLYNNGIRKELNFFKNN